MKRILMVPLDERPCNYRFPQILPKAGYTLEMAPMSAMGLKKKPADRDALAAWLKRRAADADILILALDTLVYGGLIPSRLHRETREELTARADLVRELRAEHPGLKIYLFMTVMRCPRFSNGDEEPDYYWVAGEDIHRYGVLKDKEALGLLTEEEKKELGERMARIPREALEDYTMRRAVNLDVLLHALGYAEDGTADGFIVPQDDSAPFGFTAMDRRRVHAFLKEHGLTRKVLIYPAADDTGMTMLARAVNEDAGTVPKIYVAYASHHGQFVTPSFEDRTVGATVKCQIMAAGCRQVSSLAECDIVLAVNIGAEMIYEGSPERCERAYDVERDLPAFLDLIEYALGGRKFVAVADVAYPTHSDLELLELLRDGGLLFRIHAYAGWNTSSNTLGTVIAESCLLRAGGDTEGNKYFLLHRYYDDVGYCSHARTWTDIHAVPRYGCTVFVLDGERGRCVQEAKGELVRYMRENFPEVANEVEDIEVVSPWNRTFEIDLCLKLSRNRS